MQPQDLVATLVRTFPDRVLTRPGALAPYESDGLTTFRARPRAVVLARVAAGGHRHRPLVPRGRRALHGPRQRHEPVGRRRPGRRRHRHRPQSTERESCGSIPTARLAVVEPGVINLDVTAAAAPHGLYYAPDPSSQSVCTIGGNVAFNSGGAHCFRHGMTANHVLGLKRRAAATAAVWQLGGESVEQVGPDLTGLFVGCEGLFGIALEITLRLHAAARGAIARCLPVYARCRRRAMPYRRSSRRACCRARWKSWIGSRLKPPRPPWTPAIRRAPRPFCSSSSKGDAARSGRRVRAADARDRGAPARPARASPAMRRIGRASGRDGNARSRRSAASAPTSSSRTASCRARGWARRSRAIQGLARATWHPRRQRVSCRRRQSASADPVRWTRGRRARTRRSAGRRHPADVHQRLADRSRANTASAWRSGRFWARCTPPKMSPSCSGCATRSIRASSRTAARCSAAASATPLTAFTRSSAQA